MDRSLRIWESEPVAEVIKPSDARFSLLTDECYEEGKANKVISELRTACKGTAVGLWKVIRTNEALDYLGTRGMQTSKIYRAIADYFGELPYSERNFRDARDKK
jgi:riboflavin biosynthesis pyrimidine reductase